jgi:hypothetical protein
MNWARNSLAIACLAMISLLGTTAIGQVWVEVGDAPDDIPNRQDTSGVGPLTNIRGATSEQNRVDVYSIVITDPLAFYATTDPNYANGNQTGTASYDTRLFLFDENGGPVLANDDSIDGAPFPSLITDPSVFPLNLDASAVGISLSAGKYLLAVTGWANDPEDAAGTNLFSTDGNISVSNIELHGPNTAAGAFVGWEGTGEFGDYNVELGGATFCMVPEPSTICLAALGLLGLLALRRR